MANKYTHFKCSVDDGIALIEFDFQGRDQNLLNEAVFSDLKKLIDFVASDDAIKGAVLTSKKADFCLGADISNLSNSDNRNGATPQSERDKVEKLYLNILSGSMSLRKMETCGKPFVAALNGSALGGGFELALACHYRIAADNPKARFGLPEASIGVLPGAGGTQRLPRMISAALALPLLLQGKMIKAEKAKELKIIDEICASQDLIAKAKQWALDHPKAVQAWDEPKFRMPGGKPHDKGAGMVFFVGNAQLRKNTYGNYPAQKYIMSCVYEGLSLPMDAALRVEARFFTKILRDPRAQAMTRSLFLSMQALKKGARRPQGFERKPIKKLGVIGAGLMGSGIAYVAAKAGIKVVLIDRSLEDAQKGQERVKKIASKEQSKNRLKEQDASALINAISFSDDYSLLDQADLIIEAVFEKRELKAEITQKAESQLAQDGIMASNTSTLPITGLAKAFSRPSHFIGLHFFSPVERMELVEIICGKETSDESLARAMDFVAQIRKTPIVVNDSRGFYTSRCFGTYVNEGIALLSEGVPPAMIENAGKMTGMPMPPLALADAVGLDLSYAVREQTKKDLDSDYQKSASDEVIEAMVKKHNRIGKKSGKGFYDYNQDGTKKLWHGLGDIVGAKQAPDEVDIEEVKNRLLYIQSIEAVRCLESQVITDIRDGDIGAILGWGFAPWSGGPLSLIDIKGSQSFSAQCADFAQKYGQRFAPPPLLAEMAQKNEKFYSRFAPQ